jgi:hypothetical protein
MHELRKKQEGYPADFLLKIKNVDWVRIESRIEEALYSVPTYLSPTSRSPQDRLHDAATTL